MVEVFVCLRLTFVRLHTSTRVTIQSTKVNNKRYGTHQYYNFTLNSCKFHFFMKQLMLVKIYFLSGGRISQIKFPCSEK